MAGLNTTALTRRCCLLALATGLAGCAGLRPTPAPSLAWALRAVEPLNVSVRDQRIRLVSDVRNHGPGTARLARVHYALELDEELFIESDAGGLVDIERGNVRTLAFDHVVELRALARLLESRRAGAHYRFHGYVVFADRPGRQPFEERAPVADLDLRPGRAVEIGL